MPLQPIRMTAADPSGPEARCALHAYFAEVVGRWHGRAAGSNEIESAMADDPSDDLVNPTGTFVVAYRGTTKIGCGGLRYVDTHIGELTRVFVATEARGSGAGTAVVTELERIARASGKTTLRLDTRTDLVEALRLYARLGYRDVAPFNTDPYAQVWLSKPLA